MLIIVLVNEIMIYSMIVIGGLDVRYVWKYCVICFEIYIEIFSIINFGYFIVDYYQFNGIVYNMISVKLVIVQITVVN